MHNKIKTITSCAILTALAVIAARLLSFAPNAYMRISFETVPIVISGILFGPVWGGAVGFASDVLGCLFSPYGYNPVFSLPPVLYGISAGIFKPILKKKISFFRLLLIIGLPAFFGSVLWQSFLFDMFYTKSLVYFLATRSVQYFIITFADSTVIRLMFKTNLFYSVGFWRQKYEYK